MNAKECEQFQGWLLDKLYPFAIPILISPTRDLEPTRLNAGSGLLISQNRKRGLVTCLHVWEEYKQIRTETGRGAFVGIFGEGASAVEFTEPKLLSSHREFDLAVVCCAGIPKFFQKKFFELSEKSIHRAQPGDILVILGFPGVWRKSSHNRSDFQFGALPVQVGDVSPHGIVVPEASALNREVFDYLDAQLSFGHDSCGGLSGAPAFFITEHKELKMAGIVTKRACGGLFLSHANQLHGLLNTPRKRKGGGE